MCADCGLVLVRGVRVDTVMEATEVDEGDSERTASPSTDPLYIAKQVTDKDEEGDEEMPNNPASADEVVASIPVAKGSASDELMNQPSAASAHGVEAGIAPALPPVVARSCLDITIGVPPLGGIDEHYYKQVAKFLGFKHTVVMTKAVVQHKHNPAGWAKVWNEASDSDKERSLVTLKSLLMQAWWQTEATANGEMTRLANPRNLDQPWFGEVYQNDEFEPADGVCSTSVVKDDCFNLASTVSSLGGLKVAVIIPCSSLPGGGVATGADSFEAEAYRRTDISRSMEVFTKMGKPYPIKTDHNHTLVHQGVSLMRGPVSLGLPFFEDWSRFTTVTIGMKTSPSTTDDPDSKYCDLADYFTMTRKVRMVLRSAIKAGCNVVVVPPFGCIDFMHPRA